MPFSVQITSSEAEAFAFAAARFGFGSRAWMAAGPVGPGPRPRRGCWNAIYWKATHLQVKQFPPDLPFPSGRLLAVC